MKVIMINSVCGVGSTGRICVDLCNGFREKKIDTYIAYGRGNSKVKDINTYKIGNQFDNYFHLFETRVFDNHGFSSKQSTKKLISFLKEYKPDIIHLHNLHGYYINIEILFKYLADEFNGKIIWTLHDCWSFSGHSASIDDANFKGSYAKIKEYPKTLFFNKYAKNLNRKKEIISNVKSKQMVIVTPSRWLANMVDSSYLKKYQTVVINNGIDQNVFQYRNLPKGKKKVILGVANIWDKKKGIDTMGFIADNLSHTEYEVVVVGKIAKGNKISEKITHIERTDNIKELANIYNKAAVFVNPTIQDNYPTTNLEALSCGIPVITYKTGGSGECIESSKYGKVIQQGNREELIEEIKKYSDYKCNAQIADFSKKFDKTYMIEQYIKLTESFYNKI